METNLRMGECPGGCGGNQETCSKIVELINAVKGDEKREKVTKLLEYLSLKQVSLQTQICFERKVRTTCKTKKQQNSVLKAILTLPEGCDIIKKQLDSLVILEEDEVIGVKLGPKTLFSLDGENSKFELDAFFDIAAHCV